MKHFILKCFLSVLLITTVILPPKKADAGIILITGGAAIPAVIAIAGGIGMSSLSFMLYADCGYNDESRFEIFICRFGYPLGMLAGVGLVVLDEEGSPNEFKTIPSYLIEEVKSQAVVKGDDIKADPQGLKLVPFTDQEVDQIFELADESTSQSELDQLRAIMTEPKI